MDHRISDAEKDAFWDLAALTPKRKSTAPLRPFSAGVHTVQVTSLHDMGNGGGSGEPGGVPPRTQLTPSSLADGAGSPLQAESETVEYTPADNDLVTRVRILRRSGDYRFYGQFRKDAIRYLPVNGKECPFAHFFSYIPQYAQLTEAQRNYYFYWRSELRAGNYLRCEESYFYLFVYEIINLPDYIPPKDGIDLLCRVWSAYRRDFPRVDKYMVEWVVDYCLVHALPAPSEMLAPFLDRLLPIASFKEFYLGGMGKMTREGVNTALAFFSDYRYRDSRYAKGEYADLFSEHIPECLIPVLRDAFADGDALFRESTVTHRTRDAFCGSLCAHHIRSRIEVSYYAIADAVPLRAALTAAAKHAENRLRALLSVKSRLSVPPLKPAYREHIDAYFRGLADKLHPRSRAEAAEYDHLYAAPSHGISLTAAMEIENASWENTRILLPDGEELSGESVPLVSTEASSVRPFENGVESTEGSATPFAFVPSASEGGAPAFSEEERRYLSLVLLQDSVGISRLLSGSGRIEEELAAHINELTSDYFGDIVLENDGTAIHLIEDYKEEVSAWIL